MTIRTTGKGLHDSHQITNIAVQTNGYSIIDNNPVKKSAMPSVLPNGLTLKSGSTLGDYLAATDENGVKLFPEVERSIERFIERQVRPSKLQKKFKKVNVDDLLKIKVEIINEPGSGIGGSWDVDTQTITLNLAYPKNINLFLVHELEHAIQSHVGNWGMVTNTRSLPGVSRKVASLLKKEYKKAGKTSLDEATDASHALGLYNYRYKNRVTTREPLANMAALKSHKGWNMSNVPTDKELEDAVFHNSDNITSDIFDWLVETGLVTDSKVFLRYLYNTAAMLAPGALVVPALINSNDSTNTNKN